VEKDISSEGPGGDVEGREASFCVIVTPKLLHGCFLKGVCGVCVCVCVCVCVTEKKERRERD
jgi:hypothetical protein